MNHSYYMHIYPNPYYSFIPSGNYNHTLGPAYWHTLHSTNYSNSFFPDVIQPILKDHGGHPFVVNIHQAARQNNTFRDAIWTGHHLQVTLMSIDVGDDIGLEIHHDVDQFLRIEEGQGFVQMGKTKNHLNFEKYVGDDSAIMIPAGTWHNLTNIGNVPLKLYSIYGPPNHPFGTIHKTKADAED